MFNMKFIINWLWRRNSMKKTLRIKGIVIAVVLIFLSVSIASGIKKNINETDHRSTISPTIISSTSINAVDKTVPITFSIYEKTGIKQQTITISSEDATEIYKIFANLENSLTAKQSNEKTEQLQRRLLDILEEKNAIPAGVTNEELVSLLQSPDFPFKNLQTNPLPFQTKASEWFCNFASTGQGSAFPIIILPRFIPIIMGPIPRLFVYWKTPLGVTSCGGLRSGTGFIASGQQQGVALGFWGIGFSIFLPPVMAYGMFGYALYTKVTAEEIEYWPPNNPPEITQTDPADGEQMVPITTTELRFEIQDADGELMNYNVTTEPNIGTGSGGLKPDGIYSVPVSGLESLTTYTWYIEVTDGKDMATKTVTFTTEPTAPILTNPLPPDGERDVPINLSQLKFTLKDYQGDTMDYTVQTSPNIGSAQGTDVHDGTYAISISGMTYGATYRWYVNVTDGVYYTRKIFSFETGYPAQFNPFDYGWQYRKQITIDHTQVLEDQTHFPALLSTNDGDLSSKAQIDGGDIMFMHDIGVSTRIYHDLESYTSSSGTLLAWVDIPSLSSSTDTVFYMYYGNPTCINQAYPKKTWDSNFEAVWHMNDASLTTIKDSTTNDYIGTKIGPNEPQQSVGQVGPSQDFDGINDYIQFTNPVIPTGTKTISAWINRYSTDWNYAVILTSSTGINSDDAGTAWSFIDGTNTIQFVLGNGYTSGHYMTVFVTVPDTNAWHYYTMTYDDTSLKVYLDGALAASTTTKSGTEQNPTYNLWMGETNDPSYDYYLNAGLDEIQISNIVRSENWIQLSYNMMMNPSQFITIGPEIPAP